MKTEQSWVGCFRGGPSDKKRLILPSLPETIKFPILAPIYQDYEKDYDQMFPRNSVAVYKKVVTLGQNVLYIYSHDEHR
jgi:hypothetical protein